MTGLANFKKVQDMISLWRIELLSVLSELFNSPYRLRMIK